MVELLEPITRSRLDLHDNGSVIIPAILPPRIALGHEKIAIGQINPNKNVGSVVITVRNEAGRAQGFNGRITYFDEDKDEVDFSLAGNDKGRYAYVNQKGEQAKIFFDVSEEIWDKIGRGENIEEVRAKIARTHPVFAYIIKSEPNIFQHRGIDLGAVDFLGFLRGKDPYADITPVTVDKAA